MVAIRSLILACGCILIGACTDPFAPRVADSTIARTTSAWPSYGGTGGSRYAALGQIDRHNVADLEVAWVYRTGDMAEQFQATPILAAGQLVFCTPGNEVVSLDPLTGGEIWRFDPQLDKDREFANNRNCRGVAQWHSGGEELCAGRILMATNDARLLAIDVRTGTLCSEFGVQGVVDLTDGVGALAHPGEYQVTSPPAVLGDHVLVGSAISDNQRVDAPSGVVRAYHVRSGALVWAFDLAPPDFDRSSGRVSEQGYALGTPNVWSVMSVDAERDLVFLPTGNPAPDYYRDRASADLDFYGSSIVAVRGATGEVVWRFQTVIHDFWDFDVPAQPVLVDLSLDGGSVPVVIQSTKMGFVFVLHRETGEPVVDVAYLSVPRQGPLAEQLSPVQPFPPEAFQVSRSYEPGGSLLGLCNGIEAQSVIGPVYTPISQQWTIGLPSNMGAINWGGVAVDPVRGLIAVRTSSVPFRTRLIARAEAADLIAVLRSDSASPADKAEARAAFRARFQLPENVELAPQTGTDYLMARHPLLDPLLGLPCSGLPLGEVLVIDIARQQQRWRRPHGTTRDVIGLPLGFGMPGVGGSLVTESGLFFAAGIQERAIRAYDMETGEVLWHHRLPAPGNATPMSYLVTESGGRTRQFVVIAAGGDARTGIGGLGDFLVAFALPDSP